MHRPARCRNRRKSREGNYNTLVLRVSQAAVRVLFCVSVGSACGLAEVPALPPLKGDLPQKYDAYIAVTEARIQREVHSAAYLWAEQSPERWQRVRKGDVVVEPWNARGETAVGNGLLHDWIGALFIPAMTLTRVTSDRSGGSAFARAMSWSNRGMRAAKQQSAMGSSTTGSAPSSSPR